MKEIIRNLLQKIINDLDAGNTNIDETEAVKIAEVLKTISDRTRRMSKYEACQYLNISRATFDNYVREGKLPKGTKEAGFKELSWSRKELDMFINKNKK